MPLDPETARDGAAAAAFSGEKRPVTLRRSTTGAVSFGDVGDVCTETTDVDITSLQYHVTKQASVLFAGGVAGSIGKTFTAPLSRLTILYQVHSMVTPTHKDKFSGSLSQAFMKVVRREGVFALWKGNGASVVHRFPYSAVNFFTYEWMKDAFDTRQSGITSPMLTRFVSGAVAAATSTTVCYPIDLIRTRLITQLDNNIRYRGISHAFHRIRAEEGTRGLYRGLSATLLVTVPNMAINFTVFESLKDAVQALREDATTPLSALDTLSCGALSGISSSIVTFPVDVVRRRMQISGLHHGSGKETAAEAAQATATAWGIAKELYQQQGVRGFYRGLTPELLKVIPMVGITFGTFDMLKQSLHIDA
ncbi:hypothetical protein H257_17546 [Aphanomyces astaci]|uniref:Mitochondrial carrier protein n=2 Tax=Aphanomyces astaci TaxID=112090 RepID=W4FG36_APHAT|nr:hypothetical protein H257_17546 [Aphanomyces astaci]ETV65806.1 hypothetical protein H257_17546 [Aphanomyces astaci]|eukprot:XP_009844669.1 hypothetical protein H257_17546 [Aphanomyces astaci]